MALFTANAVQEVSLNDPVLFSTSNSFSPGIFLLGGNAAYRLIAKANIAIPTGGTVGPIAIAIAINGTAIPASKSIFTPSAVEEYGNVTAIADIVVPRGCCFSASVVSAAASNDPTVVPAPVIETQNVALVIERVTR